jgi:hypothetical protein
MYCIYPNIRKEFFPNSSSKNLEGRGGGVPLWRGVILHLGKYSNSISHTTYCFFQKQLSHSFSEKHCATLYLNQCSCTLTHWILCLISQVTYTVLWISDLQFHHRNIDVNDEVQKCVMRKKILNESTAHICLSVSQTVLCVQWCS